MSQYVIQCSECASALATISNFNMESWSKFFQSNGEFKCRCDCGCITGLSVVDGSFVVTELDPDPPQEPWQDPALILPPS